MTDHRILAAAEPGRTRNVRALWKGLDRGAVVTLGRTRWTCSPCWFAHSSIVGALPAHKRLTDMADQMSAAHAREVLARTTSTARTVSGHLAGVGPSGDPVDVRGVWSLSAAAGPGGVPFRLAVASNPGWTDAISRLVNARCNRWEIRIEPWSNSVSWWKLEPGREYPVAVLAGVYGWRWTAA